MNRQESATVFGCAAVLLSYPDESFADDMAAVTDILDRIPSRRCRTKLVNVVQWLSTMSPIEAAAAYVDTFDLRRGTSLYLSWYRHGNTRERGMALAALVDSYRTAGFAPVPGELPDFLPALLELAAVHPTGAALLGEHRAALEGLRIALEESGSGYTPAVGAVMDALPAPTRADREALARFRSQGPPTERVGLEPYGPPELLGEEAGRR